ncbi:alkene reductase [Gallionella capsiferriformans]|jgi:N-ethylmaleimide reductase|uniref:NADH:flavin oxidoreductase/NADH oxidase n=1 Tax=Gallionella capsiferriformans (strain ES-2) TaxID=395494 RepID=D9SFW6_GALCS|nr:alkene reductase [Gallionella capsiferriformans]ADL55413.1 NADH:flavin oxidoreductase/NADH oxidase [Gallionella capsiferriformans ES-2]
MTTTLFTPITLGPLQLPNRIAMAPMTRCRAIGSVPNALMEAYYRNRADAGLLISEGISPSVNGLGYARQPGLFNAEQISGWQRVNQGVHQAGGHIFVQLMHTGRVSHPANMQSGSKILAPSALAAPGEMWTDSSGMQPYPVPSAMTEAEIEQTIAEYVQGAKNAREAGFDGVEIHAANGYMIDQFLNTATNQRTDNWGGSIANRIRFAVEIAKGTAAAIGADRVGMRISPYGVFNGTAPDAEMDAMYLALIEELNRIGLVYIHIVDHSAMGAPEVSPSLKAAIRANFKGRYILSGGYDLARANSDLDAGRGDLVAFGRPFISNPDLVGKLRSGAELTAADFSTFYTPGEKGYSDY